MVENKLRGQNLEIREGIKAGYGAETYGRNAQEGLKK